MNISSRTICQHDAPLATARRTTLGLALLGALGLAAPAIGDSYVSDKPDDSWITVSGEVTEVSPDSFYLDHGAGRVLVEMDDWDYDADGYKLVEGDQVTVFGVVDDDLFETRTIEASSVYVESLNTYFYASAADEESAYVAFVPAADPGQFTIQGTVTEVGGDEVVLNTGLQRIDVDLSDLAYDPLDDEGFQKIENGDRVAVTGDFDMTFFLDHDFIADSIVTLKDRDQGKAMESQAQKSSEKQSSDKS